MAKMHDAMHALADRRTHQRPGVHRIVAMEVVSGIGDGVFWVGLAAVLLHRDAGAEGFTIAALARLASMRAELGAVKVSARGVRAGRVMASFCP